MESSEANGNNLAQFLHNSEFQSSSTNIWLHLLCHQSGAVIHRYKERTAEAAWGKKTSLGKMIIIKGDDNHWESREY